MKNYIIAAIVIIIIIGGILWYKNRANAPVDTSDVATTTDTVAVPATDAATTTAE